MRPYACLQLYAANATHALQLGPRTCSSGPTINDTFEFCCTAAKVLYSTVGCPASELDPETDMLGSTAIISARMSRIG